VSVHAPPALVLCAHGTRNPVGRETVHGLVAAVAGRLPEVPVLEAYVDVQRPEVSEVVAGIPPAQGGAVAGVVVPLLLAAGYHVHVDVAASVASRPDVVTTPALGPDDRLVALLTDRLREAGVPADTSVVLAAAGSSDPRAQQDSAEMARRLGRARGGQVTLAYAAGPSPTVADAVRSVREAQGGSAVAVASYLLAPGSFQSRLGESGADVVTGPLAPDARLVDIVVDRYLTALREAAAGIL
jgi:sirohydrochlorin ferrochelatase